MRSADVLESDRRLNRSRSGPLKPETKFLAGATLYVLVSVTVVVALALFGLR